MQIRQISSSPHTYKIVLDKIYKILKNKTNQFALNPLDNYYNSLKKMHDHETELSAREMLALLRIIYSLEPTDELKDLENFIIRKNPSALKGLTIYISYLDDEIFSYLLKGKNHCKYPSLTERIGSAFRELSRYPKLYNNPTVRTIIFSNPPHEMIIADAIIQVYSELGINGFNNTYFMRFLRQKPQKAANAADFLIKIWKANFISERIKKIVYQNVGIGAEIYGIFGDLQIANLLNDNNKLDIEKAIIKNISNITHIYKILSLLIENSHLNDKNVNLIFQQAKHAIPILIKLKTIKEFTPDTLSQIIDQLQSSNKNQKSFPRKVEIKPESNYLFKPREMLVAPAAKESIRAQREVSRCCC